MSPNILLLIWNRHLAMCCCTYLAVSVSWIVIKGFMHPYKFFLSSKMCPWHTAYLFIFILSSSLSGNSKRLLFFTEPGSVGIVFLQFNKLEWSLSSHACSRQVVSAVKDSMQLTEFSFLTFDQLAINHYLSLCLLYYNLQETTMVFIGFEFCYIMGLYWSEL